MYCTWLFYFTKITIFKDLWVQSMMFLLEHHWVQSITCISRSIFNAVVYWNIELIHVLLFRMIMMYERKTICGMLTKWIFESVSNAILFYNHYRHFHNKQIQTRHYTELKQTLLDIQHSIEITQGLFFHST